MFLICVVFAFPAAATDKKYRVAFLDGPTDWSLHRAVSGHLGFMGYKEGKDIVYQHRGSSALAHDKLPELAVELVEWNPDVIVTSDVAAASAAVKATVSIPIVTMIMVDPVEAGLVNSIAKPGRNLTGIVLPNNELIGKKLELLGELVPELERVGVIFNPATEYGAIVWRNAQLIAAKRGLGLEPLALDIMSDVIPALKDAVGASSEAFMVIEDQIMWQHAREINEFVIEHRLPVLYPNSDFIEWTEGLISYGPDLLEIRNGIADIVDRILKGADPAELPMQQFAQLALVVGRGVAEDMGLDIPQSILVRTTRVIDHAY
jgi:putative ABC transport system substrate-binding protein